MCQGFQAKLGQVLNTMESFASMYTLINQCVKRCCRDDWSFVKYEFGSSDVALVALLLYGKSNKMLNES